MPLDKGKIKTLKKFMDNPIKYVATQAACVSRGKKLGLSGEEAGKMCRPHYKDKEKAMSKLKASKPMSIRKSSKKKRNPEKEILAELSGGRKQGRMAKPQPMKSKRIMGG